MFMCIQKHASQISTRNACQEHLPIWLKGADSSRSASFRDWTWSMWSCWRLSWWWLLLPVGEFGIPRAYYFGTHAKAIQTPVPSQGLNSSNAWNTSSEPTFGPQLWIANVFIFQVSTPFLNQAAKYLDSAIDWPGRVPPIFLKDFSKGNIPRGLSSGKITTSNDCRWCH